jgi:hypothetical protein
MNVYDWLIQTEDLSPVICPLLKSFFPFRRINRSDMGTRRGAYKVLMEKPD